MAIHFERELGRLRRSFLALSGMVEENVRLASKAMIEKNEVLANKVIETDIGIDDSEVDLEEDCLKILALYQPFARDLRHIVAILKINNDLERIGDLAVGISRRSISFSHYTYALPPEVKDMSSRVMDMLRRALNAFVEEDIEAAREVCAMDSEVDLLNSTLYDLARQRMHEDPEVINFMIHLLTVSRHLERMADHVTNIAEDVIYYLEGRIVRHHLLDSEDGTEPIPNEP